MAVLFRDLLDTGRRGGGYASIPLVTWMRCPPRTTGAIESIDVTVVVGLAACAGLAAILWWIARARFFREADRAAIA